MNATEEILAICASEPPSFPAAIQPHGLLLAVDKDTLLIEQVSENIESFLGLPPDECIGKPLGDIIGRQQAAAIVESIYTDVPHCLKSAPLRIGSRDYEAAAHYSDDCLIVEMEEMSQEKDHAYEELRNLSVELLAAQKMDELYGITIRHIRMVTGFERVSLYKFDEDRNGKVIAEDKAPFMPAHLGMIFPLVDTPHRERILTSLHPRLIADTKVQPVGLYPQPGDSRNLLETGLPVLRSAAPVHVECLDNIGVAASLSVSVIQNDQLWGLIVCHNQEPLFVPYRIRILCEIMEHVFSARLTSLEAARIKEQAAKRNLLIEKLSRQINLSSGNDALHGNSGIALEALAADGLIVRMRGKTHSFGKTPDNDHPDLFLDYCHANLTDWIACTNNTGKFMARADFEFPFSGGFLAVPIGTMNKDIAVWLRNAKPSQQPGRPAKSEPWTNEDISAARTIAEILLESEKIQAQRANTAKSEFLANMSHELRTPMNAVIGIINILNKDKQLTARQREMMSPLNVSASSLLELINDLLDIARIESGEIIVESEPMTVSHIMEDIRSLMKVKAYEKKLELNVSYDRKNTTTYLGDPMRIRQILVNLVNNAIKFTSQGFVNILLSVDSDSEDSAVFTFDVIDSGIGMSEDQMTRIFEKFVQADASTTRKYGGTGLGLAITQNLVHMMDGAIEVTSKKGMGTRFTVKIPVICLLESEQNQCGDSAAPVIVPDGHPEIRQKILLVEDYEGNIVVALYFLQEKGYDVVIANNGQEAVLKMEREEFDCVLMDVQMPVMDGYTATRIIREKQQNGEIANTPILGMTANAFKEDRQKCLDAGMDDYISKPLDFNTLEIKIKTHIAGNGSTAQAALSND